MKVAIAGAGAVGRSIAQELVRGGHAVTLLERRLDHVDPIVAPAATWVHGDACELELLEEAGLQDYDVVIAATGDDKVNLVFSLLAKTEFGCGGWWPGSTILATSGCSTAPGVWTSRSPRRACWPPSPRRRCRWAI